MRVKLSRYPRPRTHQAFTLVEVLVALAIVALLTAVLLPALSRKLVDARTTALSQTFLGLSQGIAEFKRATTRYPSTLVYLSTQPVAANTDICGNSLSTTPVSLWRGPYSSRDISANGIQMSDAVVQSSLGKVLSGTSPIFILINAYGVESGTVVDLESSLDGGTSDANSGTIRWVSGSTTSVFNVSYAIPVNSC
jgi:prepilin-type N-terminal cleavage/methylation domain-containing protein